MDEYEQLKQQLKAKTIELAGKAKENEDKNRLLLSIKEKFEIIQTILILPKSGWPKSGGCWMPISILKTKPLKYKWMSCIRSF